MPVTSSPGDTLINPTNLEWIVKWKHLCQINTLKILNILNKYC